MPYLDHIARALLVSVIVSVVLPTQVVEAAFSPQSASSAVPSTATVTPHVAVIGGDPVKYTATAGTIEVTGLGGQSRANVFYIAYTVDRRGEDGPRPLTFAYNGGPGGSSALVHMAAFGPRTIRLADAADPPPSPRTIIDNPDSLLDISDLVFIDPVGSGFSRLLPSAKADDFYGVTQDAHVTAQFIRRYIAQNDRWSSDKYLAGESYGTLRSAVTAKLLQQDGITLAGIVLMSTILDNTTLFPQAGNDEPYWLFLPSEAAVAAYHHRIVQPPDLDSFLREVRGFASGPYLAALAQGSALPQAQRESIAALLHRYTGLPIDQILRASLRVTPDGFARTLLADQGQVVARADGRFHAPLAQPAGEAAPTSDPAYDAIIPAFTAALNTYLRDELGYVTTERYVVLDPGIADAWQWAPTDRGSPTALSVGYDLRDVMLSNPDLRVFSVNGLFDLTSPFLASEYTLSHLGLPPERQSNIAYGYYPSGHMTYINEAARAQLKRDLTSFYRRR